MHLKSRVHFQAETPNVRHRRSTITHVVPGNANGHLSIAVIQVSSGIFISKKVYLEWYDVTSTIDQIDMDFSVGTNEVNLQ